MRLLDRLKILSNTWVILGLLFIAAAIAAFSYNQYMQAQTKLSLLQNPEEAAKIEMQDIIEKIGKIIELPQDEVPTLATITDIEKLKNQAFFERAQNGDKVLIYSQAKKAIIYRPNINKVIDIAPLNIGTSSIPTVFPEQEEEATQEATVLPPPPTSPTP